MALKTVYEKKEEVPERFLELYTERDGKWELTGIEGMKTGEDVARVQTALEKERKEHKDTKTKLKVFDGLDPEKVHASLDEIEELRVRAEANDKGGIDDDKLDELVTRRVTREKAPIERENKRLADENAALTEANTGLTGTITSGKIETEIRKNAEAAKVVPSAIDDIVTIGKGIFEVQDDGAIVTRDSVGVTPGVGVDVYLTDMKERRPHWWPASEGGGANGSDGGNSALGDNPWTAKHWNLTNQGKMVTQHGIEKATQMAKTAGSHIGATSATVKAEATT